MGLFKRYNTAASIIDSIGEAIDRNVTNMGEKLTLLNELQRVKNEYERELTARHSADMQSDSWLSKNVRPMTLVALMSIYLLFSLFDALGWVSVGAAYLDSLDNMLTITVGFYFGSRGIEKIVGSIIQKGR